MQNPPFIHAKPFFINMFTNSKQVFDAITKGQGTTAKTLTIEILAIMKAYKKFEIDAICLVSGNQNPADALRKLSRNGALTQLLAVCTDKITVLQWVDRSRLQSPN